MKFTIVLLLRSYIPFVVRALTVHHNDTARLMKGKKVLINRYGIGGKNKEKRLRQPATPFGWPS